MSNKFKLSLLLVFAILVLVLISGFIWAGCGKVVWPTTTTTTLVSISTTTTMGITSSSTSTSTVVTTSTTTSSTTTTTGEPSWVIDDGSASGGTGLHGIYFNPVNPNQGWAVGDADGTPTRATIIGYSMGPQGGVWDPEAEEHGDIQESLLAVFVADYGGGFAVGDNGMIAGYNGAQSRWDRPDNGMFSETLNDVAFIENGVNWRYSFIVGDNATIIKVNLTQLTFEAQDASAASGYALYGISFVGTSDAWVVGESGTILKYDGNSFASQTSNTTRTLMGVHAVDENNVWAVGINLEIMKYNGTSWSQQYLGAAGDGNAWLYAVHFVSSLEGWAVGTSDITVGGGMGFPLILHTTNGGTSWVSQEVNAGARINDICFAGGIGWAVSQGGEILKYE